MTYPNVLALAYMRDSGQTTPEIQMRAETYVNEGYQRLLTFEVSGGGWSLFGQAPADRMLTAYGLMEFSDMAKVYPVDEAVNERAARWLMNQQEADGSWRSDRGTVHYSTWQKLQNSNLPMTAYIIWALAEAGYGGEQATQRGADYLTAHLSEAGDPYVLALVANALAAMDARSSGAYSALNELAGLAISEDDAVHWKSEVESFMGGRGNNVGVEVTAMTAYALLRTGRRLDLANRAVTYLIRAKDPNGTWYTTQGTILALKTLTLAATQSTATSDEDVTLQVRLNDGAPRTVEITRENFDVVQMVVFDEEVKSRENEVAIAVVGAGNLMYQITGDYYVPWTGATPTTNGSASHLDAVDIEVEYDRTELAINDTVRVSALVMLRQATTAQMLIVDLGLPPGFSVVGEDLQQLVADGKIARYEVAGRQLILYLAQVQAGVPIAFSYRLRARFPMRAQVPASSVYDYYNPEVRGAVAPVEMVVYEAQR